MKKSLSQPVPRPIDFPRADPEALAKFDPRTKACTMNCGPHAQDPRSEKERRFLCGECQTVQPPAHSEDLFEAAERVLHGFSDGLGRDFMPDILTTLRGAQAARERLGALLESPDLADAVKCKVQEALDLLGD